MSDSQLIIVALNFNHAREFCASQRINYAKVISIATDNRIRPQNGRYLTDEDALVWYGPWNEGRFVVETLDSIMPLLAYGTKPFEYTAYMRNEVIPWPVHIAERYLL